MKTKQINLYTFEELNEKAKEKALNDYRENNELSFLNEDLNEKLKEVLQEKGIKPIRNLNINYSLSCCQGDGFMFEGVFEYEKSIIYIQHSGRYYHSNSKILTFYNEDGEDIEDLPGFDDLYKSICKELENYGYAIIEEENEDKHIIEEFKELEAYFLVSGKLEQYGE